jgi:hypothetical protein
MEKATAPRTPESSQDGPTSCCHDGPFDDGRDESTVYSVLFHLHFKFPKFKVPEVAFPLDCPPCQQISPERVAVALKIYNGDLLTSVPGPD